MFIYCTVVQLIGTLHLTVPSVFYRLHAWLFEESNQNIIGAFVPTYAGNKMQVLSSGAYSPSSCYGEACGTL